MINKGILIHLANLYLWTSLLSKNEIFTEHKHDVVADT